MNTSSEPNVARPPLIDNAPWCDVRVSPLHGLGLFARVALSRCSTLVEFHVQSTFVVPMQSPEASEAIASGHFLLLRDGKILLSRVPTKFRYINHAATPNARIDFETHRVLAQQDIPADTEITVDYCQEYTDPVFNRYARSLGCWLPDSLMDD